MNTQRAVSLLVLSIFVVSLLGVVVYAVEPYYEEELSTLEKMFGEGEKKPGAPAGGGREASVVPPINIDWSGAAKAIADFGSVTKDQWFYVPMAILIITLVYFLLLRQTIFQRLARGMAGGVDDIISAIIAICFGLLTVYKTTLAYWLGLIGTWGMMIIALICVVAVGYMHGKTGWAAFKKETVEAGKIRAKALKEEALLKREAYMAPQDVEILKQMEGAQREIISEEARISQIAKSILELYEYGLQLMSQQSTRFGAASQVRQAIMRIYQETGMLINIEKSVKGLQTKANKLGNMLLKFSEYENKLARYALGKGRTLIGANNKLVLEEKHLRNNALTSFGGKIPKWTAMLSRNQAEQFEKITGGTRILFLLEKVLQKKQQLVNQVNRIKTDITAATNQADIAITNLRNIATKMTRWTKGFNQAMFNAGLVAARSLYTVAQRIEALERAEEGKENALVQLENKIKALDIDAIKEFEAAKKDILVARSPISSASGGTK